MEKFIFCAVNLLDFDDNDDDDDDDDDDADDERGRT